MANKYCNLIPTNKIKNEYTKINTGFDGVEDDIDAAKARSDEIDARVDNIITGGGPDKDAEVVDARNSAGYGVFDTVKARLDAVEVALQNKINKKAILAKSANYTVVAADLNTDIAGTGTITITLPGISGTGIGTGFRCRIANVGTGTITVLPTGSDTIAGSTSANLSAGKSIEVIADATGKWIVLGFDFSEIISTHTGNVSWIAPTLVSGWVNLGLIVGVGDFATAGYHKDAHGYVHLKGFIKSGSTTVNSVIATLPAGYRPAKIEGFCVYNNDGAAVGTLQVDPVGNILFVSGGNSILSLSGITFKAEQ